MRIVSSLFKEAKTPLPIDPLHELRRLANHNFDNAIKIPMQKLSKNPKGRLEKIFNREIQHPVDANKTYASLKATFKQCLYEMDIPYTPEILTNFDDEKLEFTTSLPLKEFVSYIHGPVIFGLNLKGAYSFFTDFFTPEYALHVKLSCAYTELLASKIENSIHHSPYINLSSIHPNQIIEECIDKHNGFIIADYPTNVAAKDFIINNLECLKQKGVSTILIDGPALDIGEARCKAALRSLNQKYGTSQLHYDLLLKAKNLGIKVISLDNRPENLIWTYDSPYYKEAEHHRLLSKTASIYDTFLHNNDGKPFVMILDNPHRIKSTGIPGISDILKKPVIGVYKDAPKHLLPPDVSINLLQLSH